jgi:hypothetical protein
MRYVRAAFYRFQDRLPCYPIVRWLNVNGLWFDVNLVAAIGLAGVAVRRRQSRDLFTFFVLSLPLSYSLGFALATTGMDHRFLFPSTLLMQCITLAYAVGLAVGARTPTVRAGSDSAAAADPPG